MTRRSLRLAWSLVLAAGPAVSLAAAPPEPGASGATVTPAASAVAVAPVASAVAVAPVASGAPVAAASGAPVAAGASAGAASAEPAACTAEQERRVRLRRRSVVRVQSGGVHGHVFSAAAGVIYPTPRHVVTHRSALGVGRTPAVMLVEGEFIDARAIGALPGTELVLLELEREAPWPAVELAPGEPEVGAMVLASAIDSDWHMTLHRSGVLARSPGGVLLDNEPSKRGGAPLFDCEGRVVGLAGWGPGYTPAGRLRELVARPQPVEIAALSFLHATVGVAVHAGGERPWFGAMLGGAVSVRDQVELRVTAAVLGEARSREQQRASDSLQGVRLQIETTVGYRWLLIRELMPTYLVPTVGLASSWDWSTPRSQADGVRPSLGLRAQMFPLLGAGYSIRPADWRFRDVTHQIVAGLDF